LRSKHGKDVFVPECKTGGTWQGGHQSLDAWAIKPSWANPLVTGYEIKISRSDFVNDDKWKSYMDYCNAFYFVCPTGLIQPDELPANVGLMWVARTGTRLYTKRKAPWRDVEIPESIYRYILFSRCKIVPPNYYSDKVGADYWQEWLKVKQENKELGWLVSQSIRKTVEDQIDTVRAENKAIKNKMDSYDMILSALKAYDLVDELGNPVHKYSLDRKMKQIVGVLPAGLLENIRQAINSLESTHGRLSIVGSEAGQ